MAVKTVMLYARVSDEDASRARSVADQLTELHAWVAREGWRVVEVFSEQGSASRFAQKERPEWRRVMAAIKGRRADALLTWENSRATRTMESYVELRDACAEYGVAWGYAGHLHTMTDLGSRLSTGVQALVAEHEAAQTRERVLRGVRYAAERGMPHGRHLYGYARRYEGEGDARKVVEIFEDPVRGPVVREAARRALEGESLYAIARDFNERALPAGAKDDDRTLLWMAPKIRQMLMRPGYMGKRVYRGEVVGDAAWPPLLDQATWDALQALFADPSRQSGRGEWKATHLLSGIARCGVCGSKLAARYTRSGQRTRNDGTRATPKKYEIYSCVAGSTVKGAGFHVSMSKAHLDDFITRVVVRRLSEPEVRQALNGLSGDRSSEQVELRREIAELRAHLDRVRAYAAENLSMDLLVDQEARVKPKIADAERRLRELSGTDPIVLGLTSEDDVQGAWDRLDMQGQRHVIRCLMIPSVLPATRPGIKGLDPGRVNVTWVAA